MIISLYNIYLKIIYENSYFIRYFFIRSGCFVVRLACPVIFSRALCSRFENKARTTNICCLRVSSPFKLPAAKLCHWACAKNFSRKLWDVKVVCAFVSKFTRTDVSKLCVILTVKSWQFLLIVRDNSGWYNIHGWIRRSFWSQEFYSWVPRRESARSCGYLYVSLRSVLMSVYYKYKFRFDHVSLII